ncbi:MAG: DUF1345 domain-containing protein [Hyphomicrobiales bacterium]|nr:MAG: DUF1345 domain-containing protein [Hyphomicrobiales bacterium]
MSPFHTTRHFGFYAAAGAALLAGLGAALLTPQLSISIGVNAFFLVYLGFMLRLVPRKSAQTLRRHAAEDDAPAPILLLVMLAAVVVSAATLFVSLAGEHASPVLLILGIASVVLGWFAIHTMWAMHYAYEYYSVGAAGRDGRADSEGGLDFPGGEDPDGTAFLYFAYVIGMTAQTADTNVTSNAMRRLVAIHGVFSFFFNTVLVAAAVNIVVSLAN